MRRALVTIVLVAGALLVAPARPAAAVGLWSGVCDATITVDFDAPIGLVPRHTTARISLSADYLTPNGNHTLTMVSDGNLTSMGFGLSCVAGSANNGFSTVRMPSDPSFPGRHAQTGIVMTAGTLELYAEQGVFFVAAGAFTPDQATSDACKAAVTSGGGFWQGTYSGTFAFHDPEV